MRNFLLPIGLCVALGACMPADGEVLRSPLDSALLDVAEAEAADAAASAVRRRGDLDLLRRLRRAMAEDPELEDAARDIVVLADRGEVLLRGTVENAGERDRVERRVLTVEGVRRVVNRLETME